jgi:hypothetical protein
MGQKGRWNRLRRQDLWGASGRAPRGDPAGRLRTQDQIDKRMLELWLEYREFLNPIKAWLGCHKHIFLGSRFCGGILNARANLQSAFHRMPANW